MNGTDVHALRLLIAEGATECAQAYRVVHPDWSFYAFALYTTDDVAVLWLVANSEQSYRDVVTNKSADASYAALLNGSGISVEQSLLGDYRWEPFAWVANCVGVDQSSFDAAWQLISKLEAAVPKDEPLGFPRFKAGVLAAMVLGLGDAAKSGAFGDRGVAAAVNLCCSVVDSAADSFLEADSARRLNTPAAFDVYRRERLTWIGEPKPAEAADPESLYGLYLAQVAAADGAA